MTPGARIEVSPDAGSLATAVAGELLTRLADAQTAGHEPHVALTGGTIAEAIHAEVARLSPGSGVDWDRVVLWWGDERFVERASGERNAQGARAAFLDAVGATQVHEMPATEDADDVAAAAAGYEQLLASHGPERFEVVMLGLGQDAHVASLFPGFDQLAVTDRAVVPVTGAPKPPPERVSLTYAALNRARSVWFVVSGEGKAEAVAATLAEEGDVQHTPARGACGEEDTVFFLDTAAASAL